MNLIHQHPHFRALKKQGVTYADMHYHSDYSMDSSTHLRFIEKRAHMLGCGVALTDHNAIQGSLELNRRKKIMVVPSIEITPSELIDIIPFFYKFSDLKEFYNKYIRDYLKPNIGFNFNRVTWKFEEMINRLENYRCLITLPHLAAPYPQNAETFLKEMSKKLLEKIDGFEVLNSLMKKERNERTVNAVKDLNKCFVGGSDGHTLLQMGHTITITENSNLEGFLDYIRKKQNIVMGHELNWSFRKTVQLIIIKNAFILKVKEQAQKPIRKASQTIEKTEKGIERTVKKVSKKSMEQFRKVRKKSREEFRKIRYGHN
ncbi:hypothetical protein HYX16_04115 [Candidatus Woesearchaeota archaeon]|nr:hypothetical protein [Candidatus Woesearchaeota archaeon]